MVLWYESRGDEAGEAGEAVAEAGALGGDVPTHEAFAGGAVHGAGVEPQAGLVAEFFLEDGGGDAEGAAVHPHQIGALEPRQRECGEVFGAVFSHQGVVAVDVFEELLEPFGAVAVGLDGGDDAEGVDIADLVVVDGAVDAHAHVAVGADYVGNLQTRDVEGLARRHAGDGACREVGSDGREGGVAVGREDEFAVDFVRDDDDVVAHGYLAHAGEFFACPDAPGGVVGVAQQEKADGGVGAVALEVGEVYAVVAVLINEGTLVNPAAVVAYRREEAVIDGSLDQHLVAGTREGLDDGRERRDHAGGVDDCARVDGPAVARAEPVADSGVVFLADKGVAEDALVDTAAQGIGDAGSGPEVHVGNPHGQDVGVIGRVPFV